MTIIEFFDKSPLDNIAGALLCRPEKVIYVGDRKRHLENAIASYQRMLTARGIDIHMACRVVNRNKLSDIVETLRHIISENTDCVFDLTGGDDLYLVAVGMIMSEYVGSVHCHRFNFRNSTIIECDNDGNICATEDFAISVEENVIIHGGEIIEGGESGIDGTYNWDFNDDFCCDIDKMWQICRIDSRLWNSHVGTLGALDELYGDGHLSVSFEKKEAPTVLKKMGIKYSFIVGIMRAFEKEGLISSFKYGDRISFTYKNDQVKRALSIAGQLLELAVAKSLIHIKDDDGNSLYHDTRVGVIIDWDGGDEVENVRTVNEIDVFAMKDSIPVFISCKNGNFEIDELYKLHTVAEHFGSQYAKKVLIANELYRMGAKAEYLRARAEDMNIRLIENINKMDESELERVLKSLWRN